MIKKIISGGQTGVDRAALDYALAKRIPHGGWCPKGRMAEDGVIDNKYQLIEIDNGNYRQRTKCNVMDSDGTLILNMGKLEGGTLQTVCFAESQSKPYRLIQLDNLVNECEFEQTCKWLIFNEIKTLNIAGPRESKIPDIYNKSFKFLEESRSNLKCNIFQRKMLHGKLQTINY